MEVKEEVKTKSQFLITIDEDNRIGVEISGPHISNKTFNRLSLGLKKAYRNHIRAYRLRSRRDRRDDKPITEPDATAITMASTGRVIIEDVEEVKPEPTGSQKVSLQDKMAAIRAKRELEANKN